MKAEEFLSRQYEKSNWSDEDIMSPPTEAQDGLNILIEHFLGKDWYSTGNITNSQVNTEAIYYILKKYPNGKIRRIKK